MTTSTRQATTTERLFRIAVAIKGIDGGVQLVAAIALLFIPPTLVLRAAHAVITRDLVGDPNGALAAHLQEAAGHFAGGGTRWFAILYLLLHGLVKLGLVVALWRKIMPAYPVAVLVLAAFVVYEVIRAVHTHSIALPFFAALDVVIIVLVVREYLQLRRERAASSGQ